MNTFTLYLSSLILALVLPISILAMYLMLAHKTQLASASAMNSAVVQRFDSEAARAGWHDDFNARFAAHGAKVQASYQQTQLAQLKAMDPELARPYLERETQIGTAGGAAEVAALAGTAAGAEDAVTSVDPVGESAALNAPNQRSSSGASTVVALNARRPALRLRRGLRGVSGASTEHPMRRKTTGQRQAGSE